MNCVDTCGWLEYFAGSVNADNFAEAIEHEESLIVPTIVIYEVFKKILIEFDEDRALIATAHMKRGKVVPVTEPIALHAAKLSLEKKLPMADALIYATADLFGATLFTQDNHFESMRSVRYFKKTAM